MSIADDDATFNIWCDRLLDRYLGLHPADAARLADLRALLRSGSDVRNRKTLPGHLTASALIVDPGRKKLLLLLHKGLGRWLQPGGHLDPGEFPLQAALREVAEEVGLSGLPLMKVEGEGGEDENMPLDIDSHPIPARPAKGEAEHTHHDFLYVLIGDSTKAVTGISAAEVGEVKWVDLEKDELPGWMGRPVGRLGAFLGLGTKKTV